jgi:hypothetical protein
VPVGAPRTLTLSAGLFPRLSEDFVRKRHH